MSSGKVLVGILIAAVLLLSLQIGWTEYEFRSLNGRAIEVGLVNWGQEVGQVRDKKPVLVYFYQPGETDEQRRQVERFAWWHARDCKVVRVLCDPQNSPENLIFAARFAAWRYPAFVVLYGDKEIRGANGVYTDKKALDRMLSQAVAP